VTRLLFCAAALALAGCNPSAEDGSAALADANESGNAAAAAVENAVAQSSSTPLEKEAALALMERRHEDYERIGDAMKVISRELRADTPDLAAVRQNAATIAALSPQVQSWFPAGTGPDVGDTEALAAIWENPQDFAAKARDFDRAAQAFNAAAQSGDVAAIRSAQADLGRTCKACHDLYREEH
jgi:cytochrome c556